jgi:hypothetical protein
VATLYGCCGALDANRYFGLETGAQLFVANGPVALLEIPNSGGLIRLAGVDTPWSANQDPIFAARPDAFGIVAYVSLRESLQRVLVVVEGDMAALDSMMALPIAEWVLADGESAAEFTHWALDGERDAAMLGGVSLRVTYTPEAWVEIPVVADRLDIAAAQTAAGLALEVLP